MSGRNETPKAANDVIHALGEAVNDAEDRELVDRAPVDRAPVDRDAEVKVAARAMVRLPRAADRDAADKDVQARGNPAVDAAAQVVVADKVAAKDKAVADEDKDAAARDVAAESNVNLNHIVWFPSPNPSRFQMRCRRATNPCDHSAI